MKVQLSVSASAFKQIPTPKQLAMYKDSPAFQAKYETDQKRIDLYNSIYDRVAKAWKANHTKQPGGVDGQRKHISLLFKGLDAEFPKVFTEAQIIRCVTSDKIRTALDAWDYLAELAYKKAIK